MKKRIIAPIVAMAAVLTLSVSAAAVDSGATGVDPGATNKEASATATVAADKETVVELDNGVKVVIEAGAFADGEVTVTVKLTATDNANNETAVAAIKEAIEKLEADATGLAINTKIEITITDKDGKAIQPAEGKKVTVTVAEDGKSNIVAYVGDDVVEFIKLSNGSFETTHFSTFYLATVANAGDLAGKSSNPGTGVVLVAIPAAIIAAAAVVVSKKRK